MNGFRNKRRSKKQLEKQTKTERLYHRYSGLMYAIAYRISGNTHDAEDIVAEAFIKVMRHVDKIKDEDIGGMKCKYLMVTIIKNTAYDWNRKYGEEAEAAGGAIDEELVKDTQDIFFEMEDYKELIQCIDELQEQYRDVLRMRILYGLSSREIGEILGISESHVNVCFMRAKNELRRKLEGREREQ